MKDGNPYHELFDDYEELQDEEMEAEVELGMAVHPNAPLPKQQFPAPERRPSANRMSWRRL